MIIKAAIPALLLSVLTGCATKMSPAQQDLFAKEYSLLNICSERGLMNPDLAANGMVYYRDILRNKSYDADALDAAIANSYKYEAPFVSHHTCKNFSTSLYANLIEQQRAAQSLQNYSNAMYQINQSMQQSNQNFMNIINENNNRMRQQTCYKNEFGSVRCF